MSDTKNNSIQIYQAENGALEIQIDQKQDTIWLNLNQIALLFEKDRSVISRHIKNIFAEEELEINSTRAFFATVQKEGGREVKRDIEFFNLDLILSVGYRTNSKKAVKFRQWASTILKDYLLEGYSINQKLLQQKTQQIEEIRQTLNFLVKSGKSLEDKNPFLEVLNRYTNSLITLNQFDEDRIITKQGIKGIQIEIDEFRDLVSKTKEELMSKNEATELFGQEYEGKFESSVATIYQSFGGQELYSSLEEKSANLLYLIIKNHGFVDGNKRIGSILFVYYLAKNKFLYRSGGEIKINDNTLVALALLIAQSRPEDKEILVKLIIKLIQE
jgi:prophage maintenance system killer protein